MAPTTTYAIASGSNRRHGTYGDPRGVLRAAVEAIEGLGKVMGLAPVFETVAVGPAGRRFANSVLILESALDPPGLLAALKAIERSFGRRRGRAWGPRVLDLDIILWSGGAWGETPTIPHPEFRSRRFVLEPLARIAPAWRDPISGATVRQLLARQARRAPVDRPPARS